MKFELRHMAARGKTFFFASLWLTQTMRNHAAIAYSFCRIVDDLADDIAHEAVREAQLESLKAALLNHDTSHPHAAGILSLIAQFPDIAAPVLALVEACQADKPGIRIQDDVALREYAHGVAGNVGLIMYPILGGTDATGLAHAAELGIAMQLTNIARDILEDLTHNRVYIPATWLEGTDIKTLLGDVHTKDTPLLITAIETLLERANYHYKRSIDGLRYLDPRARFAIRVAADCYAAIGSRVMKDGKLIRDRAVVPFSTKALLTLRAIQWSRGDLRQPAIQGSL